MVKNRSDFWQAWILLRPIPCLLLVLAAGSALGAFDDFEWVGKKVSPLQAFILMGTICFPVAAGFLASIGRNEALAQISQGWHATRVWRTQANGVKLAYSLLLRRSVGRGQPENAMKCP